MDRTLISRYLPNNWIVYCVVGWCLFLGLGFPGTGLVFGVIWGVIVPCAVIFALLLNYRHITWDWLVVIGMVVGLITAVPVGLLTIRWWLPLLGDLLRVQS